MVNKHLLNRAAFKRNTYVEMYRNEMMKNGFHTLMKNGSQIEASRKKLLDIDAKVQTEVKKILKKQFPLSITSKNIVDDMASISISDHESIAATIQICKRGTKTHGNNI